MRIISPFRDFYDCVQIYGQDRSLTWIRNQSEVQNEPQNYYDYYYNFYEHGKISINDRISIGFCGKIYNAVYIAKSSTTNLCFDIEEADKVIVPTLSNDELKYYKSSKRKYKRKFYYLIRREDLVEWFNKNNELDHLFTREHPIFVVSRRHHLTTFNPMLKDYEFYRIMDCTSAFQTIESYLNNLARPENNIPVVSNENMIEAKGFDLKTSFRKPKKD